jgi:hypothetical protein
MVRWFFYRRRIVDGGLGNGKRCRAAEFIVIVVRLMRIRPFSEPTRKAVHQRDIHCRYPPVASDSATGRLPGLLDCIDFWMLPSTLIQDFA